MASLRAPLASMAPAAPSFLGHGRLTPASAHPPMVLSRGVSGVLSPSAEATSHWMQGPP